MIATLTYFCSYFLCKGLVEPLHVWFIIPVSLPFSRFCLLTSDVIFSKISLWFFNIGEWPYICNMIKHTDACMS